MFDHIHSFYQPHTIPEALRLLQKDKAAACVVAGGTDLVLRAPRTVTALVDISRLGLSFIKRDGKAVRIGATTTMAELEQSAIIQRLANGILAEAARNCGGVQIRNLATVGGNLANGSPAADTATPLLALDAEVVLQSLRGKRAVSLTEFFCGPHQAGSSTALLVEIVIPAATPHSAWSLQRLARTERDLATVSVAAGLQLDARSRCTRARIALGAVAPQPTRALPAEAALVGQAVSAEAIENAAAAAARVVTPISDIRASAEYRREMSQVLVRRALQQCGARLGGAL